MKLVINKCYGGFGLSHEATLAYLNKCGIQFWAEPNEHSLVGSTYYLVPPEERMEGNPVDWYSMTLEQRRAHNKAYSETVFYPDSDIARNDANLVSVVLELGEAANGRCAELKVVEIPDDVEWQIEEYDGLEWVAEKHRTWD
jgi:hypothetical protein